MYQVILGATLEHKHNYGPWRATMYISRDLNSTEMFYAQIEKKRWQ